MSAGYNGYREGHFLSIISRIDYVVDSQFDIYDRNVLAELISNIDRDTLKQQIWGVIRATVDNVKKPDPWFDKSGNPDMLYSLPVIRSLWPECVILFAKRRGLENVTSRLVKFPDRGFEYHCQNWQENMAAWRTLRPSIPHDRFLEVDQQDMAIDPLGVAAKVSNLLVGSDGLAVAIHRTLKSSRPQQTSEETTDRILSLGTTGWTTAQQDFFQRTCGAEMAAYGYTTDASYSVAHRRQAQLAR